MLAKEFCSSLTNIHFLLLQVCVDHVTHVAQAQVPHPVQWVQSHISMYQWFLSLNPSYHLSLVAVRLTRNVRNSGTPLGEISGVITTHYYFNLSTAAAAPGWLVSGLEIPTKHRKLCVIVRSVSLVISMYVCMAHVGIPNVKAILGLFACFL